MSASTKSAVREVPDLRLAFPALAAWVVAWQGRLLAPRVLVLLAVVLLLLAAAALVRGRSTAALVAAGTLVCAAGSALSIGARVHGRTTGPVADAARTHASVVIEGTLLDDPRTVPKRASVLAFQPTVVARVRVLHLDTAGTRHAVRQPVLVIATDT